MEQCRQVTLLGDSILKGIQVDLGSRRYRAQNEMDTAALESEFSLSIHNDAHFGATVRKGSRLLDRMLDRGAACDFLVMDFGGNDCDFRWKAPAGQSALFRLVVRWAEQKRGHALAGGRRQYLRMAGALLPRRRASGR